MYKRQLLKVCDGYVADTPGFSSLDIERFEYISKDDLPYCFREFKDYLGNCKFKMCIRDRLQSDNESNQPFGKRL